MKFTVAVGLLLMAVGGGLWWHFHIPADEVGATVILLPESFSGARFTLEGPHADPSLEGLRREVPFDEMGVQVGSWKALRADSDGGLKYVVKLGKRKVAEYQPGMTTNLPESLKVVFVRMENSTDH
ncbi:MAG: hypothetical protein KF767_08520 [Bdellovibrionaceae bacterium]|nr:hypothetical protein [Pseudobdellovibrionaceae bacterium]